MEESTTEMCLVSYSSSRISLYFYLNYPITILISLSSISILSLSKPLLSNCLFLSSSYHIITLISYQLTFLSYYPTSLHHPSYLYITHTPTYTHPLPVLKNSEWVSTKWTQVAVGDIVKVTDHHFFPCDLIILSSRLAPSTTPTLMVPAPPAPPPTLPLVPSPVHLPPPLAPSTPPLVPSIPALDYHY